MNTLVLRLFVVTLFGALLSACGSGDGGGVASGGTGGTGISFGTVTDFGSIFVNDVEFSTSGATITRDDIEIAENELRKGMIVEVQGSIASGTSGTASRVEVEEAVRGPVESKTGTASAGTLVVLGQTVHVDDTTRFDNNVPDFDSISAGMPLEVHGQRNADGEIAATFIEKKDPPVVFSVRGTVAAHNAGTLTFTIGGLTVNYTGAATNDMPAGSWDGLFVEVKGSACAGTPVCGTLTATKVEPDGLDLDDAAQAEIEGFVTALTTTSDFTVNSTRVRTTGSTIFSGGLQSEIAVGVKLEVEGSLANGVLTATEVEFEDSVKLESNAIVSGSTIALEGLPDVTVTANAFTEFKDTAATASDLGPLNNRNLRVRGRASGTTVIATEIEDRGPADLGADVVLQGAVDSAADPDITILGVTADTTAITQFQDVNDNPVTRAQFFAGLSVGTLVKLQGRLSGSAVTWEEAEFED